MKTIQSYTYGRCYVDRELTQLLMEAAEADGKIVISEKYAAFVLIDSAYWTSRNNIYHLSVLREEILKK